MEFYTQLVRAYAKHIEPLVKPVMKKLCHGCQVDHPSQHQHDCLMMEEEEKIRYCLDDCLKLINEREVMDTFTEAMTIAAILRCPNHLYEKHFRRHLWVHERWLEDVTSEILALQDFRSPSE